jgi:acetyl-CoA carboxylase, biotin carboxylase subunit
MRIKRVLIANRGEIAVRIIRECRELGVETVLAVSAADREGLGAKLADRAVCLGPAPSFQSYLSIPLVMQSALSTGCDAVHPGYGFLSEKAEFARACEREGIIFIGPSSETIEAIGDKLTARKIAQTAGVAVVPGSQLIESVEMALYHAAEIGYPVMIKAAAGGGGRGVFVANLPAEIAQSFETASTEARAAFGDGSLFLERYIFNARHIEVQVLADHQGHFIHVGERDCSLQRRYQKVVEEAPAGILPAPVRARICESALRLVAEVRYVNAGTVEFLYDSDRQEFFFMEMNTRIQVEHPISEEISGLNLVREQIRIAAGEELAMSQADIVFKGHAIECRINAESPANGFRPSPGRITHWKSPSNGNIRLDTHCYEGYLVPPFYDSMLGKLIVWGPNRASAIQRMRKALDDFEASGIATNIEFHRFVLDHPDYIAGHINTRWLESVLLPAFQSLAKPHAGL